MPSVGMETGTQGPRLEQQMLYPLDRLSSHYRLSSEEENVWNWSIICVTVKFQEGSCFRAGFEHKKSLSQGDEPPELTMLFISKVSWCNRCVSTWRREGEREGGKRFVFLVRVRTCVSLSLLAKGNLCHRLLLPTVSYRDSAPLQQTMTTQTWEDQPERMCAFSTSIEKHGRGTSRIKLTNKPSYEDTSPLKGWHLEQGLLHTDME